jgi:hypothetical protein
MDVKSDNGQINKCLRLLWALHGGPGVSICMVPKVFSEWEELIGFLKFLFFLTYID